MENLSLTCSTLMAHCLLAVLITRRTTSLTVPFSESTKTPLPFLHSVINAQLNKHTRHWVKAAGNNALTVGGAQVLVAFGVNTTTAHGADGHTEIIEAFCVAALQLVVYILHIQYSTNTKA